ncbi:MAG TPA: FkbM family methyltransferase [Candidatus Acidoferrales bacterium]|nr:FkbM family methyltransferase [Candidatus Acidoferrales bacterium]
MLRARRIAGAAKHWLFPTPEVAAWRHACRRAAGVPRFTAGRIRLMQYDLRYTDLLTVCPQWEDLFVKQTLRFTCAHAAPRILDCGANVGLSTLYFKHLYPQARITAFEADPTIHAVLCENLRVNGAADVEVAHAAVWTVNGTIDFRCEGADSGVIETLAGNLGGVTRRVPSVRLRDVLAAQRVDLVKLDIEGAELDVLSDCRDGLRSVDALLLDLHELDPMKRKTPAVLELLAEAGFAYTLDELNLLPWRMPQAEPGGPFAGHALGWALLVRAWKPALATGSSEAHTCR